MNQIIKKRNALLKSELKDMVLNIIKDKIINMLDDKSSYQNSFHKIKHKKLGSYEAAEYLSFNLFNKIISNYPNNFQN